MQTENNFKTYVDKIAESKAIEEFFEKHDITPYVYKILTLYAGGLLDKQVATTLGRTVPGVTMAKYRLKRKMGCETSIEMFYKLAKLNII